MRKIFFVFAFIVSFVVPHLVEAKASDYLASLTSVSIPRTLEVEETAQVTITFDNIGKASWRTNGMHFVALYRWDPIKKVEMPSAFASPSWETPRRAARLTGTVVAPKKSATITFAIKAPSTPGTYHEEFILAAEDEAWIKYSNFALDVRVSAGNSELGTRNSERQSSDWAAELVEREGTEWQLDPEGHVMTTVGFRNTGKTIWTRGGKNFVSLYATDGKKERASTFYDPGWLSRTQVGKLKEPVVAPGEVGHFVMELRAPRVPGMYRETFTLAVENITWMAGGDLTMPIRVPFTSAVLAQIPSGSSLPDADTVPTPDTKKLAASLLLRSARDLSLAGNARQDLTFGFKNIGSVTWNSRGLRIKGVRPALAGKLSSVQDETWLNSAEPFRVLGDTKPGEIGFVQFRLKAPPRKGTYVASFQLYADGQSVDGGELNLPITVTDDGAVEPETVPAAPPASSNSLLPLPDPVALDGDLSTLPVEPFIRVGIYKTADDRMVIRAKDVAVIVTQNGTTICRLASGATASVLFDRANRVYKLSGDACAGQSTGVYLFRSEDGIAPMEIADFSRPVGWLPGANDNTFRAQLELRYTPATDSVWIINELPIEWYLKGIAETSNSSPPEFQRTLLTAARTYAMYHVQRGTKHADESYIVDAKYDQVYRGYGAEARDPNVVAAVDATRGQIVTYQGKLAITPYYSRSDGRTRAWSEVWGGGSQYPWLVSVPVPWDQGKTLWGHGVGMSATGALGMANDGKGFVEILKYFFPGTELRKAYK